MAINFKKNNKVENMKISGHCNVTNPETAGYPYLESIESFANLCDEVIVVDGGSIDDSLIKIEELNKKVGGKIKVVEGEKWEEDFDWTIIGKNLNIGFKQCTGDWAFHFDTDYIFHEDNVKNIKEELAGVHFAAMEVKKINFVMSNEYYEKDHYPLLVNKREFPIVCYGLPLNLDNSVSATFLTPIARKYTDKVTGMEVGEVLKMRNVRLHMSNIPIYTYDFSFMTQEQVINNRGRFENALRRYRKMDVVSKEKSFEVFLGMMNERHKKCQKEGRVKIPIEAHSRFIREKIASLTDEQFAYGGWGLIK